MKATITRQQCDKSIEINGYVYHDIKDLLRLSQSKKQPNVILERKRLFPCFDSSDYAHENRYFRNFLFCVSQEEADNKRDAFNAYEEKRSNFCFVDEDLPEELRPMIYYADESTEILIAK